MKIGYAAKIPFSQAEAQEEGLRAAGVDNVYLEGRGAETLAEAFRAMRGDRELHVFGGMRVFGGSRDALVTAIKDLKRRKVIVVDDMNSERMDKHEAEMLDRALRQIMGANRIKGSRKHARRIGKLGGTAKLEAMRSQRMPEELVRPIWHHPKLTIADKLKLMNPMAKSGEPYFKRPWTEATARRHLAEDF